MSSSEEFSWISCFCALRGNEFFCKVDDDYIQDTFNMTGLREQVPHYQKALNLILDLETGEDSGDSLKQSEVVKQASELLYGLIHARYLLTIGGMMKMITKFKAKEFGICPRVYCQNQPVLPIGLSDVPGEDMVKNYCPRCLDVYVPPSKVHRHTDGAYFGTSFPNMLFLTYPDMRPLPTKPNSFINYPDEKFVPRLFGFKIHPQAYEIQQQAALSFKAPLRVMSYNWGKR